MKSENEYKWVGGQSADSLADELGAILSSSELGRLREIVFYMYRGDCNDSLLFALCDCLNKNLSINDYAAIRGWVLVLIKRLRKTTKPNDMVTFTGEN